MRAAKITALTWLLIYSIISQADVKLPSKIEYVDKQSTQNSQPAPQKKKNSFTNADIPPQPERSYADKKPIYEKLVGTCNYWKRELQKGYTEGKRVNQNIACRDAAEYGTQELNLNTHWTNYTPPKSKAQSGGTAYIGSGEKTESQLCMRLKEELESIQKELRAGYTETRGNWLRKRRRNVQDQYNEKCY